MSTAALQRILFRSRNAVDVPRRPVALRDVKATLPVSSAAAAAAGIIGLGRGRDFLVQEFVTGCGAAERVLIALGTVLVSDEYLAAKVPSPRPAQMDGWQGGEAPCGQDWGDCGAVGTRFAGNCLPRQSTDKDRERTGNGALKSGYHRKLRRVCASSLTTLYKGTSAKRQHIPRSAPATVGMIATRSTL